MTRRGMLICIALLGLALSTAGAASNGQLWQQGELVSRRTVPTGRTTFQNRFLYRVQGGSVRYLVVSNEPLKLELHVPMRFTVTGRHLVIQDADGREHKTAIVRTLKNVPHGR